MENPEIVNHEIARLVVESLPDKERSALFDEYAKIKSGKWKAKGYDPDWMVKNHFHREEIAIDYGGYLNGESVPEAEKALFEKYLPKNGTEDQNIPDTVNINGENWSTGSVLATGLLKNLNVELDNIPENILRDANFTLGSLSFKMSDSDPRIEKMYQAQKKLDNALKKYNVSGGKSELPKTEEPNVPPSQKEIVEPGANKTVDQKAEIQKMADEGKSAGEIAKALNIPFETAMNGMISDFFKGDKKAEKLTKKESLPGTKAVGPLS